MTQTIPSLPPAPQIVRIDEPAPDFTARSTRGDVRLSDYRGQWLLFFSHPADFTPVCTTEFIALERARAQFEALGCALLGLSVDSVYAHIAWLRDIEARSGVRIGFPLIEDISMAVSRLYGMIHDNSSTTAAVRSVFFIDPEGCVRATLHYPANVGRSVSELLRVLAALQAADRDLIATPEGWQPGDAALMPPPLDLDEAEARAGRDDAHWYLTPAAGRS